jgi:hypothetical protein
MLALEKDPGEGREQLRGVAPGRVLRFDTALTPRGARRISLPMTYRSSKERRLSAGPLVRLR